LLKFILITFLIIFVLSRISGFLFRTLFWILGKRVENKRVEKQMRAQQSYQPPHYRHNPRRSEGEIIIEPEPAKKDGPNRNTPKDGEYVDYEEVK